MTRYTCALFVLLVAAVSGAATAGECGTDNDCKGERVCYRGRCVDPGTASALEAEELEAGAATPAAEAAPAPAPPPVEAPPPAAPAPVVTPPPVVAPEPSPAAAQPLGPDEAKLIVWLEDEYTKLKGVSVFVDGARVGEAPWEGIVSPGEHRVRVEGAGYWSKTVRTKVWPKRTRMVQVELRPAGSFDVGHFYVGAAYSFGMGSAFIDGRRYGVRQIGIGGGLSMGVKMPSSRLWWELGLTVGPFTFSGLDDSYYLPSGSSEYNEAREEALDRLTGEIMPLYLELRFLVPVKGPYVYWASSFLPGILMQRDVVYDSRIGRYSETIASFSTTLRTGLAFVLGDWWEIRLDVVGVELIFEKAFGVLYSPSFAIVLRI